MRAVILSIGDELVLGQTIDTNSAWLSEQLARHGISTLYHQTLADDQPAIVQAIKLSVTNAKLVIISGGIGPTEDDLTRQSLAEAMDVELVEHAGTIEHLKQFFEKRGRDMPQRNRVQALHPEGTSVTPNDAGTAPGIRADWQGARLFVTPGVPREMKRMFERSILPAIEDMTTSGRAILTHKVNTFGRGESDVAQMLGSELMGRTTSPTVGTTVADSLVSVRIRAEADSAAEAEAMMAQGKDRVLAAVGPIAFGMDDDSLAESLVSELQKKGRTLATAESCTGGGLGAMITDVAGCSSAYLGGWVTYTNVMKSQQLGVPTAMLEEHGAVSEPVARAMAKGALEASGADFALAITGVAGPSGGTAEKPVGTVWIGMAYHPAVLPTPDTIKPEPAEVTEEGVATIAIRFQLPSTRDVCRQRAGLSAMQLLRFRILGVPLDTLVSGTVQAKKPDCV